MHPITRTLASCLILWALLHPTKSAADDFEAGHLVSLHTGWWSLEAEYRTPFGLFVDVGFPWFSIVMSELTTSSEWDGAVGGKLGYEYPLSENWRIRGGIRVAFSFSHGCPCMDCDVEHETKSFGFVEADILYHHPSGYVIGASFPLHAFDDLHEISGNSQQVEHFFFPVSLAFSQLFVGYSLAF